MKDLVSLKKVLLIKNEGVINFIYDSLYVR